MQIGEQGGNRTLACRVWCRPWQAVPERGSLMQTCATMCYPDLEETNDTVTERLGGRGLSFNGDSYARTFKCLAVFQAGVVEYMDSS